jgi:hypothetical protein
MTEPLSLSLRIATFELQSIATPTFSTSHEFQGDELIIHLRGNADSGVSTTLASYLERLHDEATKARLQNMTLDFRELYFLTPSCIKCLMALIKRVTAMDAPSQYRINLLTSPNLRWQERSFNVLCQLAPLLVRTRLA